ncbi:MAG: hypothetical protein ABUS51_07500 [Acidobacteriota bacterium]
MLLLGASVRPAGAHNGPPFPLMEGKRVGPCIIALWTHPDVGTGTFFVILDPPPGGSIPKDLKIEIGVQPVSGRLPEVRYAAQREYLRGQVQYNTQVNFDADEIWRVHLLLHSSAGEGEAYATVEATPPGLGRWDLLFFAAPFLGAGFLWFRVATRKRELREKKGGGS